MKMKITYENVLDKEFGHAPYCESFVEVEDQWDYEPVRKKLLELLTSDGDFKSFGMDGDIIEIDYEHPTED